MRGLRRRVHERAHRGPVGHARISGQRRTALWLTVFSAVRTVAWIVCMLVIAAHWLGAGGPFVRSFIAMSGSVVFVTFISFYCNAATDFASLMAGVAAVFSADGHAAVVGGGAALSSDMAELESDVARLAALHPGPEALALAADIRRRLPRAGPDPETEGT